MTVFEDQTLRMLEERAASYGAVRHSALTAIALDRAAEMIRELVAERDRPETASWLDGVQAEAAHQRARWGAQHDAGKQPEDWLFLIGYLAGKACAAARSGDEEKALHHTISAAAALANWHLALAGADTGMRPGIDPDAPARERRDTSEDLPALMIPNGSTA